MGRLYQAILIVSILGLSWLGMQVVHELGHALAPGPVERRHPRTVLGAVVDMAFLFALLGVGRPPTSLVRRGILAAWLRHAGARPGHGRRGSAAQRTPE